MTVFVEGPVPNISSVSQHLSHVISPRSWCSKLSRTDLPDEPIILTKTAKEKKSESIGRGADGMASLGIFS
jgi:hypothetical protein